jgi:hypothetical protein
MQFLEHVGLQVPSIVQNGDLARRRLDAAQRVVGEPRERADYRYRTLQGRGPAPAEGSSIVYARCVPC